MDQTPIPTPLKRSCLDWGEGNGSLKLQCFIAHLEDARDLGVRRPGIRRAACRNWQRWGIGRRMRGGRDESGIADTMREEIAGAAFASL